MMTTTRPPRDANRTRVSRYTPSPQLPSECTSAYEVMLEVMSGTMNVSAAALALGMPRNHFQTCLHKAQGAFIEALPRGRTGRPKKSNVLRAAETTIREQQRELERSRCRTKQLEAQLAATSALIRSEMSLPRTTPPRPTSKRRSRRSRASRTTTKTTTSSNAADAEDAPARALEFAASLERTGIPRRTAAAAAGVAPSTMRRWRRSGPPRRARTRAARPTCAPQKAAEVRALVRQSRGMFGADALRRHVGDVSRRDAAALKVETLRDLERERREAATRVTVTAPGVLRGFDAMHLSVHVGRAYALRLQDGAVPFTTTLEVVSRYDADAVCAALARDFADHGPPYVLRLDRASVHRTPSVNALCDEARVLVLHGPPRCARFYGQLERAHRDLRVFAPLGTCRDLHAHLSELERACVLLNRDWRRRSLGYETAQERWNARVVPELDRDLLRSQVLELTKRIRRSGGRTTSDECRRFAIVATMIQHELLRQTPGGHC